MTDTTNGKQAATIADEAHCVPPTQTVASKPSKTSLVIALLERDSGATLEELTTATGWLPHTTRAALTGLRKKGHAIVRDKRGDVSCYTLASDISA